MPAVLVMFEGMSRPYFSPRLCSKVLSIEVQLTRLSLVVLDADSGLQVCYSNHVRPDRDIAHLSPIVEWCSGRALMAALDVLLDHAEASQTFVFQAVRAIVVAGEQDHLVQLSEDSAKELSSLSPSQPLAKQVHRPDLSSQVLAPSCSEQSSSCKGLPAAGLVHAIITGRDPVIDLNGTSDDGQCVAEPQPVSSWMAERYRVYPECRVLAPIRASEAAYRSFLPEPWDVGIGFGALDDHLLVSSTKAVRFPAYALSRRAMCSQIGYSRWSTASRLARATPPGGTIGLDDKLFCVPSLRTDETTGNPCHVERYSYGTAVHDFEDVRAESRCLLEGQVLSFRHALEQVGHPTCSATRVFCWGRAVENRALAATLCEVLGADVVAPLADYEAGKLDDQYSPLPWNHPQLRQRMTPAAQVDVEALDTRVRRAGIGAAYWAFFVLMQQQRSTHLDFNTTVRAGLESHGSRSTPGGSSSSCSSRSSSASSYHTSASTEQTSCRDERQCTSSLHDPCPAAWLASKGKIMPSLMPLDAPSRKALAMQQRMDEQSRGLVRIAYADHAMYAFYGALLPEFHRLWQQCSPSSL